MCRLCMTAYRTGMIVHISSDFTTDKYRMVDHLTNFYNAGKTLVLLEGIEHHFGAYINKHGAVFTEPDFRKAIRMSESIRMPKTESEIAVAKEQFERGWTDGQSERFQVEAITADAIARRMMEKTIALISKERQIIAKKIFS